MLYYHELLYSFLTVVDMCTPSFATEDQHSKITQLKSVTIRIRIKEDNCICRVTIDNQIQPVSITLRNHVGPITSSPEEYGCGLAIDINHIPDMPTGNVIAPIECVVNSNPRNIPLFQNSTLQFKSRIINGSFTRGYCMRMLRGNVVSHRHS